MKRSLLGLVLVVGCQGPDYGMSTAPRPNEAPDVPVDLVVDVAWQDNNWGADQTRCQVQVAFLPLVLAPDGGGGGEGAPQAGVAVPETPGTCVATTLEPPEQPGEAGEPGGNPDDGDPIEPGDADDDWQVAGDVLGPDAIHLSDGLRRLTLEGVDLEDGGVRYELAECDAEAFPFAASFALDVAPSADPDGVHAFEMPDLVAVGPRLHLDAPLHDAHTGFPTVSPGTDLPVRWSFEGPDPIVEGATVSPDVVIKLFAQDPSRAQPDRWLLCLPEEEGWFDVPASAVAALTDGMDDPTAWHLSLDVHSEVAGRPQQTPWGELLQVQAHVSSGAPLQFGL